MGSSYTPMCGLSVMWDFDVVILPLTECIKDPKSLSAVSLVPVIKALVILRLGSLVDMGASTEEKS